MEDDAEPIHALPEYEPVELRQLSISIRPFTAETISSYLGRISDRNLLRASATARIAKSPQRLQVLAAMTGLGEQHLVSALPELRSLEALQTWPHLLGEVSAAAGARSACTSCVSARSSGEKVTVFAKHEDLICPTHRRWLGSQELKCGSDEQFLLRDCVEVAAANVRHKLLISRWGRGQVRACFYDAMGCMTRWARWPLLIYSEPIRRRWRALGITEDDRPLLPREVASLYPNAVALTELILQQRKEIAEAGRLTPLITHRGRAVLLRDIVGFSTDGAWDNFHIALLADRPEPDNEVEQMPPTSPESELEPAQAPAELHLVPISDAAMRRSPNRKSAKARPRKRP
jgi:hypothetical protein